MLGVSKLRLSEALRSSPSVVATCLSVLSADLKRHDLLVRPLEQKRRHRRIYVEDFLMSHKLHVAKNLSVQRLSNLRALLV